MMRRVLFALATAMAGTSCFAQTEYWWGMGKKNSLALDSAPVVMQFDCGISFSPPLTESVKPSTPVFTLTED